MKRFAEVLQGIIEANGQTQAEIGSLSGLGQLKISRLVNGVIRADKEDLEALFRAIPDDNQKADIAIAHIRDEVPREAFQYIEILIKSGALREGILDRTHQLTAIERAALEHLLEVRAQTPEIGHFLVTMARLSGFKPDKETPPGTTKYPPPRSE